MSAYPLPNLPAPQAHLVRYVDEHPEKSVAELFEPYRNFESELRKLYAQEPDNPVIQDPYVNAVPLYSDGVAKVKVKARDLKSESKEEQERYIMPLPDQNRRLTGSPAIVPTLQEFRRNFNVFSESSLVDLKWDNVVAAGSSVVNCLLPVPEQYNDSKRALREYYHEVFCPASDVDLFLYGLTEEEAVTKIADIEKAVRDSILTETTTVRTKHAVTICSQYPTRHVQIVLRLYKSLSEILAGFDIDCSTAAYDGKQVYCTPRALQSYITQVNHVDLSRRSPSYENRLSKYSHRNFEVYWPELDRSRVDPTIFERSFQRTLGLARLLVLERLPTTASREQYTDKRRAERGRPPIDRYNYNRIRHTLYGNIKEAHEDEVAEWHDPDDISNYHTFTIPYGPRFHAKKIEKLCYTRDLLLNAEWNQAKDRDVYLHRHPAFFGRFEDVAHDCCGFCPKPNTDEEVEIAEEESKIHVSGEISFIKDDPGRQQVGSFNPLTDDDWTEMAYVGNTERLCQAIVDGDIEHVEDWLEQEGADPNTRDYTGRTPLHLAVMSSTPELIKLLVDHGARLVARIADGRTALHLAAERGDIEIVKILMEKSVANEEEEAEKVAKRRAARAQSQATEEGEKHVVSDSSEDSDLEMVEDDASDADSHSMATGSFVKVKKEGAVEGGEEALPDLDEGDDPDFYDVSVVAWDTPTSALHLAIVSGHDDVVRLLCQEYGADVLLPVKFLGPNKEPHSALLTLVLALALPIDKARLMAKALLSLGATCAQADLRGVTAFHRYVENNASELLETLWTVDAAGSQRSINHLAVDHNSTTSPLVVAIRSGDTRLVLKLLDAGAVPQIDFETWLKSAKQSSLADTLSTFENNKQKFQSSTEQPLIAALRSSDPAIAIELIKRGADVNTLTRKSYNLVHWRRWHYESGESALDIVREQLSDLRRYKGEKEPEEPFNPFEKIQDDAAWVRESYAPGTWQHWAVSTDMKTARTTYGSKVKRYEEEKAVFDAEKGVAEKKAAIAEAIKLVEGIEQMIVDKGGKPFDELHKEHAASKTQPPNRYTAHWKIHDLPYYYDFSFRGSADITETRCAAYIELFEAAWRGDLEKIKSLTLVAWGEEGKEPPLQIAVTDAPQNNPFSLAFLRGHYDVAKAILEIAQAQFTPLEAPKTRVAIVAVDDDECDYSEDSDDEGPSIYTEIVSDKFTIETVGEVAMLVKSRVKPTSLITYRCPTFVQGSEQRRDAGSGRSSLFAWAIEQNDHKALQFLLDVSTHFSATQPHDPEEDPSRFFSFPNADFNLAVARGRTEMLAEIIRRTGAGLPLAELVKGTGIALKEKPLYYQGLTVYGRKRNDWAQRGRQVVRASTGTLTSPLVYAASQACLASVEWFLTDAPARHYLDFANSKAARDDARLRHLSETPGSVDGAITRWLANQNEQLLHVAVLSPRSHAGAARLVDFLTAAHPSSLTAKTPAGQTPLHLAAQTGRLDLARQLLAAGADPAARTPAWDNLLHLALTHNPPAPALRHLLALLGPGVSARLARERNAVARAGHTPLHAWLAANLRADAARGAYADTRAFVAVLRVLLGCPGEGGAPALLAMLDGAGDTPLHTAVAAGAHVRVLRALLDAGGAALLYRENAVGRTPAELARGAFVAGGVVAPGGKGWDDAGVGALAGRAPGEFVGEVVEVEEKVEEGEKDEEGGEEEDEGGRGGKEGVWDFVEGYLARDPGAKRRLVSLNEACDVANRLGDAFMTGRWPAAVARGTAAKEEGEEEEDNEEGGAEVGTEWVLGGTDVVGKRLSALKGRGWAMPWGKTRKAGDEGSGSNCSE